MVTNSIQRVSTGYVRITFIRYALGYVVIISVDVNYIMWDARVYRLLEYRHNASPWYNGYRATCGTLPSNFPPPFLAVRIFMAGESQLCSLQGASISESNRIFNIRRFFLRLVFCFVWDMKNKIDLLEGKFLIMAMFFIIPFSLEAFDRLEQFIGKNKLARG